MESTEIFCKSSDLLPLNSIIGVRKKDIGKPLPAVQEDDIKYSRYHFPRGGCRRKDLYSKIKDSSANSSPGKIVSKSRCEHLSTNKSRPSLNPESRMNEMSIVLINSIHANAAEVETRRSFTSLNHISQSYVPNKLVPNDINRNQIIDKAKHSVDNTSKHSVDMSKHYADNTSKHSVDMSKHYADNTSEHSVDMSKHYADNTSEHSVDKSKHSVDNTSKIFIGNPANQKSVSSNSKSGNSRSLKKQQKQKKQEKRVLNKKEKKIPPKQKTPRQKHFQSLKKKAFEKSVGKAKGGRTPPKEEVSLPNICRKAHIIALTELDRCGILLREGRISELKNIPANPYRQKFSAELDAFLSNQQKSRIQRKLERILPKVGIKQKKHIKDCIRLFFSGKRKDLEQYPGQSNRKLFKKYLDQLIQSIDQSKLKDPTLISIKETFRESQFSFGKKGSEVIDDVPIDRTFKTASFNKRPLQTEIEKAFYRQLGDHLIPLDIESLIDTIKAHGRHPQGLDKRSIGIIMKIEERFEKEVHLIFNKEIQPIMINDLLLSPENPFFKAKVLKLTEPYTGDLMFLKDDQPVNFEELKMRGQFPCKIIIFKARVWAIRCNTVTIPVKLIPERNLNFNLQTIQRELQGYLELEGKQAKMNIFAKINGQKALDLNKMGKESLLDIEKEYGNIDLLMIETGMKNWKSQMI